MCWSSVAAVAEWAAPTRVVEAPEAHYLLLGISSIVARTPLPLALALLPAPSKEAILCLVRLSHLVAAAIRRHIFPHPVVLVLVCRVALVLAQTKQLRAGLGLMVRVLPEA